MISRRSFLTMTGFGAGAAMLGVACPNCTIAKAPSIDPSTDATCLLSAAEMADHIKAGKLSPVELIKMHIDRIKRVEPTVNAVTYLDEERSLDRAQAAKRALEDGRVDWNRQPLFGIPFSVKNSLDVQGIQVACGCPALKYNIAAEDAFVVAQMKRAGAIFLAATNLPFFSMITETDSALHGITKNPYDLNRTPGGSSGGEAALIALGCSPMGIGTDGGGSIRFPAAWCGLAGFCPAPKRMSQRGHFTAFKWGRIGEDEPAFMTVGSIARRVRDLERILPVIATPDEMRPVTKVDARIGKPWSVPARQIRIAYFTRWADDRATPTDEIQSAVERSARALERVGCRVRKQRPAFFNDLIDIGDAFCVKGLTSQMLGEASDRYGGQGNAGFERMITWMAALEQRLGKNTEKLRAKYPAWKEKYLAFMSEIDALLVPIYPTPAPKHGESFSSKEAGDDTTWAYLVNLVDVLPGGTVRVATSKEKKTKGLPIGVQVVGSRFGERKVLRILKELENAFGGYQPPSGISP